VSIQLRAAKKQRVTDLVPGSDEWYQRKIRQEHPETQHRFILPWDLEKSKAIALLDYQWLGEKLVGAPDNDDDSLCLALWDEEDRRPYPVKVGYIPHWIKTPKTISVPDYLAWVFLEACEYETLPVSPEGVEWKNWIGIQPVWLEQHQILKKFKKPEVPTVYPAHIQRAIEKVKWLNDPVSIDSIEFDVPVNLPCFNRHIWDWRPVPTKEDGKQIDRKFIKRYLEDRVIEWLAVGGFRQWQKDWEYYLLYSEHHGANSKRFIKPFYWDLWLDLDHLRLQYKRVEELATEIQLAWRVHCANKELQKETAEVKAEKQRIEEELFGILD
jgi:hypothetical protein